MSTPQQHVMHARVRHGSPVPVAKPLSPEEVTEIAVQSSRRLLANCMDPTALNFGKLQLRKSAKDLDEVALLDMIKKEQKEGTEDVMFAVAAESRVLKKFWTSTLMDDDNFTVWGQPTKAYDNQQSIILTGEHYTQTTIYIIRDQLVAQGP